MKKIYVDMDGCIAKWKNFDISKDEFTADGFYLGLEEQRNLISALEQLDNVYIISHFVEGFLNNKYEKIKWLEEKLPGLKTYRIYIIPTTTPKYSIRKKLTKEDILIDDYNKNLREWEKAGGTGIKFVNRHNDKHKSWTGERIYWNYSIDKILNILGGTKNDQSV